MSKQTIPELNIPFPDEKRIALMQKGAHDLSNWLNDLVKTGIAHLSSYEETYWESISKKMVDSKLSGVSTRILRIKNLVQEADSWEESVLKEISNLNLLAKALNKLEQYSKTEQLTFLNLAGFNITKKHLEKAILKKDQWQILAVEQWQEDKIKLRQTWIQGKESKFMGMLLEYAWGNQEFMTLWEAGKIFYGELKIYPSSFPLRAMVSAYQHREGGIESYAAYPNLEVFFQAYAKAISLNPLLPKFPVCLKNVKVVSKNEKVLLIDAEEKSLECTCEEKVKWSLLALSTGNAIRLFGIWNGIHLIPKSVLLEDRFISL